MKKFLILLLVANFYMIPLHSQTGSWTVDTTFKSKLILKYHFEPYKFSKNISVLSLNNWEKLDLFSLKGTQNKRFLIIPCYSKNYLDINANLSDLRFGRTIYDKIHRPMCEYALITNQEIYD